MRRSPKLSNGSKKGCLWVVYLFLLQPNVFWIVLTKSVVVMVVVVCVKVRVPRVFCVQMNWEHVLLFSLSMILIVFRIVAERSVDSMGVVIIVQTFAMIRCAIQT